MPENKPHKVRKILPYTYTWEKLANRLARSCMHIRPCRQCGYPVIDGYCCQTCGSIIP